MLASAGDNRNVRLWKSNYQDKWSCFGEIIGDTCQVRADMMIFNENSQTYRQQQQQQQNQNASFIQQQLSSTSSGSTTIASTSSLYSNGFPTKRLNSNPADVPWH